MLSRGLKCKIQPHVILQCKPKLLPVVWLIVLPICFTFPLSCVLHQYYVTSTLHYCCLLVHLFYWQKLQSWMGFVCILWLRSLQNGVDNSYQTIHILHRPRWTFSASERQLAGGRDPFLAQNFMVNIHVINKFSLSGDANNITMNIYLTSHLQTAFCKMQLNVIP